MAPETLNNFAILSWKRQEQVQYRSKVSYHPSYRFSRDETLVSRDKTLVARDERQDSCLARTIEAYIFE